MSDAKPLSKEERETIMDVSTSDCQCNICRYEATVCLLESRLNEQAQYSGTLQKIIEGINRRDLSGLQSEKAPHHYEMAKNIIAMNEADEVYIEAVESENDDLEFHIRELEKKNEFLAKEVAKQRLQLDGLERFRDLRLRHNEEMERRTSELAQSEQRIRSLEQENDQTALNNLSASLVMAGLLTYLQIICNIAKACNCKFYGPCGCGENIAEDIYFELKYIEEFLERDHILC